MVDYFFLSSYISLTKCTFSDDIAETFPRSSRRAISTDWTVIKTPNVHEDRVNVYSVPLYTQEENKIREEPEKGKERDVKNGRGDDGSDLLSNFRDALGDFASEIPLADSPLNWLGTSLNHIHKTTQKLPELLNDLDVDDFGNITLTYPVGLSHTVIVIGYSYAICSAFLPVYASTFEVVRHRPEVCLEPPNHIVHMTHRNTAIFKCFSKNRLSRRCLMR